MSQRTPCMLCLLSVVCLALLSPHRVTAVSLEQIVSSLTNWGSCLDFRIEGPCGDVLHPGIIVSYRLPHLLQDTVKIPGTSTIDELAGALGGVGAFVPGGGASGNPGEWNLQYSESHVVEYPIQLATALGVIPVPPQYWCLDQMQYGFGLTINYLSELDIAMWRANTLPEGSRGWIGVWAPLVPRHGFCIHYSPAVASGVFGYRSVDIAANPGGHVILKPLWFARDGDDRMQMAIPLVQGCLVPGTNPLEWDHGDVALDGKSLWLYWHRVRCCVPGGSLGAP